MLSTLKHKISSPQRTQLFLRSQASAIENKCDARSRPTRDGVPEHTDATKLSYDFERTFVVLLFMTNSYVIGIDALAGRTSPHLTRIDLVMPPVQVNTGRDTCTTTSNNKNLLKCIMLL